MKQENPYYPLLRARVEEVMGRCMKQHKDFILLATHIFMRSGVPISSTTLKRFWGVIEQTTKPHSIRVTTLDLLAKLCGYIDFAAFCADIEGNVGQDIGSEPCLGKVVLTSSLPEGSILRLMWSPNRCVTVRYEGMEVFRVLESLGSKIRQDATFHCSQFVEHQPLLLTCLINPGEKPVNYVCAKQEGGLFIEYVPTQS